MATAGDNPTDTFLRFLTDSGPTSTDVEPRLSDAPADENDSSSTDSVLELFAEFVDACRQANLTRAEQLIDGIIRTCEDKAPEAIDLAYTFMAFTRGDHRQAERHASDCLRREHLMPELTRPIALVQRATMRMGLGLLDAALNDLEEADGYGTTLMSLHAVSVKALVHWWRGDQGQALDALEQGPQHMIRGADFGVGWFALAAELVKNGQIFDEDLGHATDCIAREFWDARSETVAPTYVVTLGPHMIRHQLSAGEDPHALLSELNTGAPVESTAGQVYQWCLALADRDSQQLADIADGYRDRGIILSAIDAYRDAAACAPTDDHRERLLRRGHFLYDRLSRAVKVSAKASLPESIARELTEAERNVVDAVARGLSNKDAAEELQCSVRTIESHLSSVYRKLGVKRRTQLAVLIAQANVNTH